MTPGLMNVLTSWLRYSYNPSSEFNPETDTLLTSADIAMELKDMAHISRNDICEAMTELGFTYLPTAADPQRSLHGWILHPCTASTESPRGRRAD